MAMGGAWKWWGANQSPFSENEFVFITEYPGQDYRGFMKYGLKSDTISSIPGGGTISSASPVFTGISNDNKIVIVNSPGEGIGVSSIIHIYDPFSETFLYSGYTGQNAVGGVITPNNMLITTPNRMTTGAGEIYEAVICKYDITNGTYKYINAPDTGYICQGIILPNGNILFCPRGTYRNAKTFLEYNPVSDECQIGVSSENIFNSWIKYGNKIFMFPSTAADQDSPVYPDTEPYWGGGYVGIYDIITKTVSRGPRIYKPEGQNYAIFENTVLLLPNNKVMIFCNKDTPYFLLFYDLGSNTYEWGPRNPAPYQFSFGNGIMLPNGNALLIPNDNNKRFYLYDYISNIYIQRKTIWKGRHAVYMNLGNPA